MTYSNSAIIDKFKHGATTGKSLNIFIENDTLYSYGRHFPLLVRRDFGFILNADKYSVTTSQHQSACFGIATIIIPFSALYAANISYNNFKLVDKSKSRIDTRTYKDNKGITHPVEEHRPQSAVITQDDRYFLSSMDNNGYFICELPHKCDAVNQAFNMLIPYQVKGKNYQRQGEWFVIESPELPITIFKSGKEYTQAQYNKLFYKSMYRNYVLPHKDSGNPHTATRGIYINGIHYISGQLRHPEHRMLKLSYADNPVIFQAYENTAIGSWAASGNVD